MAKRTGPGRPRLTQGDPLLNAPFRLPAETVEAIRAGAQTAGVPLGIYVAEAIARYQEGQP